MKTSIKEIAAEYGSLTLRFSHIYDNGVVARVEHDRRLIVSDVVKGEGDLQKLIVKAVRKLSRQDAKD